MKPFSHIVIFLIIFITVLYTETPAYAFPIDADRQLEFADTYFRSSQFPEAILEYNRFLFFFPDDPRKAQAKYKAGICCFRVKKYKDASGHFKKIFDSTDMSCSFDAGLMLARCYNVLGDFDRATEVMDQLITHTTISQKRDLAFYENGWLYLENGHFKEAEVFFLKISEENQSLFHAKDLTNEFGKYNDIKFKRPGLAGTLAILPGAGYLYCERANDALISFLFNTCLIYAAFESFDHDQYALGTLISFTAAGFYGGNIYGSVTSAQKYNRRAKKTFIEKLIQNKKIKIGPEADQCGITMGMDILF
ncbi:MAG: tetratricopeptide repeat protein [Proteobacteria bacterium]|nr:tetratricopeptide repeat protein [Pseudomonadota bacterium]